MGVIKERKATKREDEKVAKVKLMKNYETTINLETIEKFNAMKQTMQEMLEELQALYDEKTDELDEYCGKEYDEEMWTSPEYIRCEALNRDVDNIKHAIETLDEALDMYLV